MPKPTIEQEVPRKKKQPGKRTDDPSQLPKRTENHKSTREQLTEIYGENGWERLPDEVYSKVEYMPSVKEAVAHHVAVYTCKKNDQIVRAKRSVDLLRNSVATPSFVAPIINAKNTNAIPLYRMEQEMVHTGMILTRATMGNWTICCAERYLSLIFDRLHKYLRKQHVIQVDETVCQVTKDGREGIHQSRMFVYRTSELVKEKPVILYKYEKTRSSKLAAAFLDGFSGIPESDAFSGFKTLDNFENDIHAVFCWTHARHDFADALKSLIGPEKDSAQDSLAHKALVQIGHIYKAEEALKELFSEKRKIRRQSEVLPLVEAYFAWIHEQHPILVSNEKIKDGIRYSINQEKYLRVFLTDGYVPIDNSATDGPYVRSPLAEPTGISLMPSTVLKLVQ